MRKFWVLISMLVMICMATPAAAVYRGFPLMLCSNETGNPEPCQFMKFAPANSAGLGTLSLLPTASAMYYWNDAGHFVRWNGVSGSATTPGYTRLMDGDTTALGDIELMDGSVEVATTLGILGKFQMMVWNGTGNSPADTNAGAVSAATLRTIEATNSAVVVSLGVIDDWDATEGAAVPATGAAVMYEASSAQKVAVDTGDAVIPSTNLNGEAVIAGHTWGTNSNRSDEIDPVSAHHVEATLADVTDEASGTTTYYYVDLDGFTGLAVQVEIGAATDTITYTVEGSIQDDGTAPASCVYQDITQYGMNIETAASTAADYTADAILTLPSRSNYKYVRIKTVSSGGNDTGDYVILVKSWFGS